MKRVTGLLLSLILGICVASVSADDFTNPQIEELIIIEDMRHQTKMEGESNTSTLIKNGIIPQEKQKNLYPLINRRENSTGQIEVQKSSPAKTNSGSGQH